MLGRTRISTTYMTTVAATEPREGFVERQVLGRS